MNLYDDIIVKINDLVNEYESRSLDFKNEEWSEVSNNVLILGDELAYELGNDSISGLAGLCLSENEDINDEVILIGKDLNEIKTDSHFARIVLARISKDSLGEGQNAYNAIRKIEYTKYHLNPKGYMSRISPLSFKESIRIGKTELKEGLSFSKIGRMYIDAYHADSKIEAVKIIFITLDDFKYKELEKLLRKSEAITKAVDHIMNNIIMDCTSCGLKKVCDEVEGMKELHFKNTDRGCYEINKFV